MRTSTLDALGAGGQHGSSERAKVGVQMVLREGALSKGSMQHARPVRPATTSTSRCAKM